MDTAHKHRLVDILHSWILTLLFKTSFQSNLQKRLQAVCKGLSPTWYHPGRERTVVRHHGLATIYIQVP